MQTDLPGKNTPRKQLLFFKNSAQAELASFRPCLRCRPDLVPGEAPEYRAEQIASSLIRLIDEGLTDHEMGLDMLADQLALSSRQLSRIVQGQFGVSLHELVLTRRLLLAKKLIIETDMSIIKVAFASGFASLRRFNDAFSQRYRRPPSHLRKKGIDSTNSDPSKEVLSLQLPYRQPFDWSHLLHFLKARCMQNIEVVTNDFQYCRTLELGQVKGWICVCNNRKNSLLNVTFSHNLIIVLPSLVCRLRDLFDLRASPLVISSQLQEDPLLKEAIALRPGLRVPGAFDAFEVAMTAILGEPIPDSVAAISAMRLIQKFGEPIKTPIDSLHHLSPTAKCIANLQVADLTDLGICAVHAQSLIALATALIIGKLELTGSKDLKIAIEQLLSLPGIDALTAQYIAMRAMNWPDVFPKEDRELCHALGKVSSQRAEEISRSWSPWRSYAALHLCNGFYLKKAPLSRIH